MAPAEARERRPPSSTMYPAVGAGVWRISSSAADAKSGVPRESVAAAPRPATAEASLPTGPRDASEGGTAEHLTADLTRLAAVRFDALTVDRRWMDGKCGGEGEERSSQRRSRRIGARRGRSRGGEGCGKMGRSPSIPAGSGGGVNPEIARGGRSSWTRQASIGRTGDGHARGETHGGGSAHRRCVRRCARIEREHAGVPDSEGTRTGRRGRIRLAQNRARKCDSPRAGL